ncbi:flagellar basal-body rod protein FlgG [Nitrincola alkalilacustris]|uniref:flagellar basal-body rod protein FlgG n=1 Tax=Nitrincola alkalilacustris TaxID=1571224 RepID=UPI00124CB44E|nr:flagellar basal-body rod protein FlgG [Nitrincola alkalilacustris]
MHGALHVAKTGLSAQDTNLKIISNNLANVSTVGFKKDRAVFEDLLYQIRRQPGAQNAEDTQLPSGLQVGNGTRLVSTQKMFQTGEMQVTDNAFDLAIGGAGFFQVLLPNGETGYTRNGQFHLGPEGQLVTAEGFPLLPEINVPQDAIEVSIGSDGTVQAVVAGQVELDDLGQIELANFINPQGLQASGANIFIETAASGAPQVVIAGEEGTGFINQGWVEGSNVNAVEELVNMITTQRAYEINSKVISTADQMLSFATQQL